MTPHFPLLCCLDKVMFSTDHSIVKIRSNTFQILEQTLCPIISNVYFQEDVESS